MISIPIQNFGTMPYKTDLSISCDSKDIQSSGLYQSGKIDFQTLLMNLNKSLSGTEASVPLSIKEAATDILSENSEIIGDNVKNNSGGLPLVTDNINKDKDNENRSDDLIDLSLIQNIQMFFPAMNFNSVEEIKEAMNIGNLSDTIQKPDDLSQNVNFYIRRQSDFLTASSPPSLNDKVFSELLPTDLQNGPLSTLQIKAQEDNESINNLSLLNGNENSIAEKTSGTEIKLSPEQNKALVDFTNSIALKDENRIKPAVRSSTETVGNDKNAITGSDVNLKSNLNNATSEKFNFDKKDGSSTGSTLNSYSSEQDITKAHDKIKDNDDFDSLLNAKPFSVSRNVKTDEVQSANNENIPAAEHNTAKQIADKTIEALNQNKTTFQMKLKPEGLGDVTVNIIFKDGQLDLKIRTELDSTRNLMESQINHLETELKANNYSLLNVDISSGNEKGFNFEGFQFKERYNGNHKNNNEENLNDTKYVNQIKGINENVKAINLFSRNKLNYKV